MRALSVMGRLNVVVASLEEWVTNFFSSFSLKNILSFVIIILSSIVNMLTNIYLKTKGVFCSLRHSRSGLRMYVYYIDHDSSCIGIFSPIASSIWDYTRGTSGPTTPREQRIAQLGRGHGRGHDQEREHDDKRVDVVAPFAAAPRVKKGAGGTYERYALSMVRGCTAVLC